MEVDELRVIFGHNLKLLRQRAKMTQAALAEAMGIRQPTIAAFEAGDASPSLETIAKAAEVFRVAPDVMLRKDYFAAA